MLYKIYTENKNYDTIMSILHVHLGPKAGFTVVRTEGHYGGKIEHGLVIDVVYHDMCAIQSAAYDIKKTNKQESVLVVAVPCEAKFVR